MDNIDRINAAFATLRKQGFIARQHFLCCGTCAGAALATQVGKMPAAKRAKVKGAVFTTRQDRGARTLFIKYGRIEPENCAAVGLPTVAIGEALATALKAQGLAVEWDGSPNSCVEVRIR